MAIKLQAKNRENLSRGETKQIREAGFIPAVVYGKEQEAVTVSVNNLDLLKTVRDEGRNAIITLEIEGTDSLDVMLHDYQTHPVKGNVTHIDFYVVDMSEELDVTVPVRLEGEAAGSREGGVLQQPVFELTVRAKPRELPEEIVIDVTALEIGDTLTVADLPKADKYEVVDDVETTVATVTAPEAEVEETTDGDVSVEPELVGAEDEEDAE